MRESLFSSFAQQHNHVRSVKHYFLLDQSDFLTHFLDLALPELNRPSRDNSIEKLRSLLELVIRNPSSVLANDPYKEDISVDLSTSSVWDLLIRINLVQGSSGESDIAKSTSAGDGLAGAGGGLVGSSNPSSTPLTGRTSSFEFCLSCSSLTT